MKISNFSNIACLSSTLTNRSQSFTQLMSANLIQTDIRHPLSADPSTENSRKYSTLPRWILPAEYWSFDHNCWIPITYNQLTFQTAIMSKSTNCDKYYECLQINHLGVSFLMNLVEK